MAAEVSLVSTSPRHSCLCAKKFALLGLMVGVSAKKFSLRTRNAPKLAFCGVLGEFFAKRPLEGACRAKFFAGEPVKAPRRAKFFAEQPRNGLCWANFFAETLLESVKSCGVV